ncbi:MAG: PLP-dependent aspartate aminotransferase family protein [Dongiaceae bacterium]
MSDRPKPATLAAHGGRIEAAASGGIVPPLEMATTYERRRQDYAPPAGYIYSRFHHPNWEQAEKLLAELEGGAEALLFASGIASVSAIVETLRPGERVVAQESIFWGTRLRFQEFAERWGIVLTVVPGSGLIEAIAAAPTKLVWFETPANPTWEIIDIAAVSEAAHKAGALSVVDSTAASPVLTRPIEHGADIVMHSATKYLNGHSDVLAGALVTARNDETWQRIRTLRGTTGNILGPFEAWLLLRGMRTLYLRVERASQSAQRVAEAMTRHPRVSHVMYPGLPDHPGHDIARRQMQGGFGGMVSIRIRGDGAAALRVATATRLFRPATSLGGVESLIEHRATLEGAHGSVPPDLLRLSIGIEDADDLIADLDRALAQI